MSYVSGKMGQLLKSAFKSLNHRIKGLHQISKLHWDFGGFQPDIQFIRGDGTDFATETS